MRTTITKEVVSYDELDESVKQIVLEKYNEAFDYAWFDCVYENFEEKAKERGLDVDVAKISFDLESGYAVFAAKLDDFELLLSAMDCPQEYRRVLRYSWNCCGLYCKAVPSQRGTVQDNEVSRRNANPHDYSAYARDHKQKVAYQHTENALDWFEDAFDCFCDDLAHDLHTALQREYDYLQSREYIEESIMSCELMFDAITGEEVSI